MNKIVNLRDIFEQKGGKTLPQEKFVFLKKKDQPTKCKETLPRGQTSQQRQTDKY